MEIGHADVGGVVEGSAVDVEDAIKLGFRDGQRVLGGVRPAGVVACACQRCNRDDDAQMMSSRPYS